MLCRPAQERDHSDLVAIISHERVDSGIAHGMRGIFNLGSYHGTSSGTRRRKGETMKQMDLIAVISLLLGTTATFAAPPAALTPQIIIDQFGSHVSAPRKVALFSNPVKGQNFADHFVSGATFQLRRQMDDAVVLDATLVPWHQGAVDDV